MCGRGGGQWKARCVIRLGIAIWGAQMAIVEGWRGRCGMATPTVLGKSEWGGVGMRLRVCTGKATDGGGHESSDIGRDAFPSKTWRRRKSVGVRDREQAMGLTFRVGMRSVVHRRAFGVLRWEQGGREVRGGGEIRYN